MGKGTNPDCPLTRGSEGRLGSPLAGSGWIPCPATVSSQPRSWARIRSRHICYRNRPSASSVSSGHIYQRFGLPATAASGRLAGARACGRRGCGLGGCRGRSSLPCDPALHCEAPPEVECLSLSWGSVLVVLGRAALSACVGGSGRLAIPAPFPVGRLSCLALA